MLARQLAHPISRDGRAVCVRLVVQPGQGVDEVEIVALDSLDPVVGAVTVGHHGRELALVELRVVESDGAGVHRFRRQAGHGGHDGAGVNAAGQERAQRHLGDHAQPNRLLQSMTQLLAGIVKPDGAVQREVDVPVFTRSTHRLSAADGQAVSGRQLARLAEDGARLGHIAQRKILFEGERVDVPLERTAPRPLVGQQRLQFTAEQQRAVVQQRVVQRLDPHAVARHEQCLAIAVPQHEGEHAAEAVDAALTPLLPAMHDALGVALGVENVAGRLQFGNEFLVVVDLAVEHHHHRLVFIEQRLLAGGHVDDGQASMAEAQPGLDVQTAFVGASVQLAVVHALQDGALHGP